MHSLKRKIIIEPNLDEIINELSIVNINVTNNSTVIICRVSTMSQIDSLAIQEQLCRDYCLKENLNIINIIKDIGSAYNNYDKLSIFSILDKYSNINLVINDPSRIIRKYIKGAEILNKCVEKNILIHCVKGNYKCNTHDSKKKLLSEIYDAQTEAETLGSRQKDSNKIRKKFGGYSGSVPFGKEKYIENLNNIKIIKLKDLDDNHIEIKTINLIKILYGGTTTSIEKFLQLFNNLHNFSEKLTTNNFTDYKGNKYTSNDIKLGFKLNTIYNLLNDWEITNRGKLWNRTSINNIINNYII